MKQITKFSIGAAAAALCFGGVAVAQMPAGGHRMMDPDGNGTITRTEAQQAATQMFAKLDANGDGKLDKTDRAERREDMREAMFARLDADGNGQISKTEFMSAERPERGDRMARGEDARDGKRTRRGHHGGRHGMGMMGMAKMADTDKDGAISQTEFVAAADKHFAMMDSNSDGQVTKEERQAARATMKAKWKAARAEKAES
jgi:Ca2+-binding EF-hand superfamily protein